MTAINEASEDKMANTAGDMQAFWNTAFREHQAMWGFHPSRSAAHARDLFVAQGIKDMLLPGIGYGRNAKIFTDAGIRVTGIEIAQEAIDMARAHYGEDMKIFRGSVTDMPFDAHVYEGIFCYGLVYLLNPEQRKKMIAACYNQLKPGGWMVFSVVSKKSPNYGKGRALGEDTFEVGKGGQVFFYDEAAVQREFGAYGIKEYFEIEEQVSPESGRPAFIFLQVVCRKAG
ncbi:class I SAM-dependent methyltransferase [Taibaiella helva]|uniref:class I SAM-dependent methyltransferase n=1 Tax=Taibaiella helva TaxID=2301235 RepID=UPI001E2ACFD7|nr:class I SAM-dependent methyltransferase [Taibaiella helva]